MAITEVTDTTSVPNKIVKKFTTNLSAGGGQDSTTWTCPVGVTSVRCLVVAGGGGGGNVTSTAPDAAGGGGAGGMIDTTVDVISGTAYVVKVGAGGNVSATGYNSSLVGTGVNLIAYGGGRGGDVNSCNGGNGGSGGGPCGKKWHTSWTVGTGVSGQGRNSGTPAYNAAAPIAAGGGGAGSVGGSGTGYGGNGIQSSITGANTWYAGGGGGGRAWDQTGPPGGSGGGGRGAGGGGSTPTSTAGTNGLGGGGGGGVAAARDGSVGGSGVVILQYDVPTILVRTRQFNVTGSGNLLVMEVQT